MKNKIYIVSFFITLLQCPNIIKSEKRLIDKNYNKKIETRYQGFFSPTFGKNSNQIMFTVRNKTSDTLYLSYDNFNIEVIKNGSLLKPDSMIKGHIIVNNFISNFTFLSDDISKLDIEERALRLKKDDFLKRTFAEKLHENYVKIQKKELNAIDKKNFLNSIYASCLVLLPKETVSESFVFMSESLNHDCTANAEYSNNDIFTTFVDENNTEIGIKY